MEKREEEEEEVATFPATTLNFAAAPAPATHLLMN